MTALPQLKGDVLMTEVEDLMARLSAQAKALIEANAINKTAVFAALTAASITRVTVTFDGAGDSGQMNDINAKAGEAEVALPNVEIQFDGRPLSLSDAIEHLCFDYLSQEHGGWENNDGGQGEFTFDVAERRIELDFNQFYMDSTNYSHTF
jgi:hypothetical protein